MEHHLCISFVVSNPSKPLNKEVQDRVHSRLKDILRYALERLPEYKFLERAEPGISTPDETKQLRCRYYPPSGIDDIFLGRMGDIIFDQHDSSPEYYFTLEELAKIAKEIQKEIEEFLHYGIFSFITCRIDVD